MEKFENCTLWVIVNKKSGLPSFDENIFDNYDEAIKHISRWAFNNKDKWEPRILEKKWLENHSFCLSPYIIRRSDNYLGVSLIECEPHQIVYG